MITAMLYGPGGAQRVEIVDDPQDFGDAKIRIRTRDGETGWVDRALLQDFRTEEA